MSVESAKPNDKSKNSPDQQKKKENPDKKKTVKAPRTPKVPLPALVELSFSVPVILILGVDFAVFSLSYAAGADWVTILARAIVATVVIGGLTAIIAYVISAAALADAKERLEKEQEKAREAAQAIDSDGIRA